MTNQTDVKKMETNVKALETELLDAGTKGDLVAMQAAALKLADLHGGLAKALLEVNAEANATTERDLMTAIQTLVDATDWEKRNRAPIDTVVWYRDRSDKGDGTGPVIGISINPKRPKSRGPSKSGDKRGKSSAQVTRTVDGKAETLSIKDVVTTYADDEVKGLALYGKKAWTMLYDRVNDGLTPKFAPVAEQTEEATTESPEKDE